MDPEILSYNRRFFESFGAKKLRQLIELLEEARAAVTEQ
jgi:hypothetical protein